MNQKTAVMISRRFSVAAIGHMMAGHEIFRSLDYKIFYRADNSYTLKDPDFKKYYTGFFTMQSLFRLRREDVVLIWFTSVRALWDALIVRTFTKADLIFIYHEPELSFFHYIKGGFGFFKSLKVMLISTLARFIYLLSRKAIFPSSRAFLAGENFKSKSILHFKLPLLFCGQAGVNMAISARSRISYIGRYAEDHCFENFLNFAVDCVTNGLLTDKRFLIFTSNVIPVNFSERINFLINSGRVDVVSGNFIPEHEINNLYDSSFVVWNVYRRSMQSGVLPRAYMCGVPVLISRQNKNEYFTDGVNGSELEVDCSNENIVEAIKYIEMNYERISRECIATYMHNFHYSNNVDRFKEILKARYG